MVDRFDIAVQKLLQAQSDNAEAQTTATTSISRLGRTVARSVDSISNLEAAATHSADSLSNLKATVTQNVDSISKLNLSVADVADLSSVEYYVATLTKLEGIVSNIPDPFIIYIGVAFGVVGLSLWSLPVVKAVVGALSHVSAQKGEISKQPVTAEALETNV